ncbi:MAG TPA: 3-carboxy-cis,cis-muconate cycloisomerase, partial [Burkholderiaceae bacterium]|nr:3-carboxy-cis,cis-muconate cycloisomerase [Burkholderiaceae bacterium]
AIGAIGEALAGLRVDADAMRANLERMQGFVFAEAVTVALSDSLGRPAAQALVERICRRAFDERRGLRDALADDAQAAARLDPQALERLFDPASQTGSASAMIDAVLARWESPAPHSG